MQNLINVAYIFSSILFIFGIKMLGRAETAKKGNLISGAGMLLAVAATLLDKNILSFRYVVFAIFLGTVIGIIFAYKVKMIHMPEMVAMLNGFGGFASLLVGIAEFHKILLFGWQKYFAICGSENTATMICTTMLATFAAVFIGAITFTGSLVAYLKLAGKIKQSPVAMSKFVNFILFLTAILLGLFLTSHAGCKHSVMYAVVAVSLIFGVTSVIPIGGSDMPVVISLLNSLSGMAAAAAGFILTNVVLIVAGCLVGTSGLILTAIMCKSMNRSLGNVLFSGFGNTSKMDDLSSEKPKAISVDDAHYVLEASKNIIFVPGYGMAVAQAQHVVKELAAILEANGSDVRFAIHPVAGRMPGHMNVLLAEADIPYEQLIDMDTANNDIKNVDVAIVIGANDVVNPAAIYEPSSPIYGMPIINVHLAKSVFVLKRGAGTGFSGLQNKLFTMTNTRMIYGDAKKTISDLIAGFKGE